MDRTVSSFSRTLDNLGSNGFYPTRERESGRLGRLFRLRGETCVLEPCIGDGTAVTAFKNGLSKGDGDVFVYGVEINSSLCEEASGKAEVLRHADFLLGMEASRSFSLCFCNPPYLDSEGKFDRLETAFAHRIFNFLLSGAYLVLIVPVQTCRRRTFADEIADSYEVEDIYRFDDDEYAKWHQLALILKRKERRGHRKSEAEELLRRFDGSIPYIPEGSAQLYEVPVSRNEEVTNFRTIEPDYGRLAEGISGSPLLRRAEEAARSMDYKALTVGVSPTPATKDDIYRLLMAGFGHGLAGTPERGDVHLNRGVCRTVTETEPIINDDGKETGIREITHTAFSMKIIEPCGKITDLGGKAS